MLAPLALHNLSVSLSENKLRKPVGWTTGSRSEFFRWRSRLKLRKMPTQGDDTPHVLPKNGKIGMNTPEALSDLLVCSVRPSIVITTVKLKMSCTPSPLLQLTSHSTPKPVVPIPEPCRCNVLWYGRHIPICRIHILYEVVTSDYLFFFYHVGF